MRLSRSLSKGIMRATVSGLLNTFKLKSRRSTYFFHDILAEYLIECENAGFAKDFREIGRLWMALYFKLLIPSGMKQLSPPVLLNNVAAAVWQNLGLMEDFDLSEKGDILYVMTLGEAATRKAGINEFMVGFHEGVLGILYHCQVECIDFNQGEKHCEYTFKRKDESFDVDGKNKSLYDQLNKWVNLEGFTLNDALRSNLFQMDKNNTLKFRNTEIIPLENTLFHLMSNRPMLLDRLPGIAHAYFRHLIDPASTDKKKLVLLKTLLQTMGWGAIKIIVKDKTIIIEIKNPPYGLQKEKDNWSFLIRTVLGYLWTLDQGYHLGEVKEDRRRFTVSYLKN